MRLSVSPTARQVVPAKSMQAQHRKERSDKANFLILFLFNNKQSAAKSRAAAENTTAELSPRFRVGKVSFDGTAGDIGGACNLGCFGDGRNLGNFGVGLGGRGFGERNKKL